MNPSEMGCIFGLLMKHREIHGNPSGRTLRDGELDAARMLTNCSQTDLAYFDEFLLTQGFTLYIRDAFEFGIPAKHGRPNMIYVITRSRGSELAPYLNSGWFIDQMRDRRSTITKPELVFWITRLWLTLQWFFYQRIDRMPSEVSSYRDALVSEALFIESISQGIERLGNEGRPEGEAGLMWDAMWEGKKSISGYASKFIKVMESAGMIEAAGNPGEYRQTLLAAIDMAAIAENELAYLMPAESERGIDVRTIELLIGEVNEQKNKGGVHAIDPTH